MSSETKTMEADHMLIKQANEEYSKGFYANCLNTLSILESMGINVKLNRAIVQFYQSECKAHDKLLDVLDLILNDDVRIFKPIALYNKAVVHFHRHMYSTAIETLTPLMDKIEALDPSLVGPVAILMLRLLLVTHQLNKAKAFVENIRKNLGLNISTDGNDEQAAMPLMFSDSPELMNAFKLLSTLTQVLNRKIVVVPEDASVEYSALKAHQYYIMKDFQMASKQLKKINDEDCPKAANNDLLTCVANNMGVIHLRVRHYAIAAKFFQNALVFDKPISSNINNIPLHYMSLARSVDILYNLGISMLHLRRPKEAFQCLLVSLKTYSNNARLWFRIAEACIMEDEMKSVEVEREMLAILLASKGNRRKVILRQRPRILYTQASASLTSPESSMEFAAVSLRNSLMLTKSYLQTYYEEKTDNNETTAHSTNGHWNKAQDNNFCNPSKPIPKASLYSLLSAIYAAYSYVSLRLGDYVRALEMAQELLKQDRLSDAHKLIGRMYVAEALLQLQRSHNEIRPHLEHLEPLNAFDFETRDWQVKSLDAAQNIVRYNLAVITALQGDIETATALLMTCKHNIVALKVVALKLHIEAKKLT